MDIHFEEDTKMAPNTIETIVRSQTLTSNVQNVLDYLALYQSETPTIIPVKTTDRIEMIKVEDLVFIDVDGNNLILETLKGRTIITERMYKFTERLNNPDFVQVSKHATINIKHLVALETSFSGNMLAILTGKRKLDVSRRYLLNLERRLGL